MPGDLLELLRVGQRAHLGRRPRAGCRARSRAPARRPARPARRGRPRARSAASRPCTSARWRRTRRRSRRWPRPRGRRRRRRPAADLPPSSSVTRARWLVGALGDVDAGLGRAGERDLVDARVAHERAPDRRPVAGDDVEHAVRDARLGARAWRARARSPACGRDGLTTIVQPAASAGASFQVSSSSGEFHGHDRRRPRRPARAA